MILTLAGKLLALLPRILERILRSAKGQSAPAISAAVSAVSRGMECDHTWSDSAGFTVVVWNKLVVSVNEGAERIVTLLL
jgi:hypothetical protein